MREGEFVAKSGARVTVRRDKPNPSDLPQRKEALNRLANALLFESSRPPRQT